MPRRCVKCYYVLEHLGEWGDCPECGTHFNLLNPWTYTVKPPLLFWTLWAPALLTATIFGTVTYFFLIAFMGYGWSTTVVVPLVVGILVTYRYPFGRAIGTCFAVLTIGICIFMLYAAGIVGVFCGLVFGLIAFVPALAGGLIGYTLRQTLKNSNFSQRWHLPLLLMAIVFTHAYLESFRGPLAVVSTQTSMTLNATPDEAWSAIQFYEEVKHAPPWLLRLTPSF